MSRNDEIVIGGLYRHYKNKLYRVKDIVRHSETLEEMVLYEAQYANELGPLWVRPKEMFLGTTLVGGIEVKRFAYVTE